MLDSLSRIRMTQLHPFAFVKGAKNVGDFSLVLLERHGYSIRSLAPSTDGPCAAAKIYCRYYSFVK